MNRGGLSAEWQRNLLVIAMIIVGAGIASSPLLEKGWFVGHDSYAHLLRIYATCHEVSHGDYYPRWLSLALYGKGLPDLNFYSPAFYLVVGWLHSLGLSLGVVLKGLCYGLFLLGGAGAYVWTRKHSDTPGALIAATLYIFTPYHFLDLYVREALPEFAALALLPWLFHAIDLSFAPAKSSRGIVATAVATAALVLTHNLTVLMIVPFAALYFCWHSVAARKEPRTILFAAAGPIAGVGLSAYYWLPVIAEFRYIKYFQEPVKLFEHFVYPAQWFSLHWGFGGSVPGPVDGMGFQLGAVLSGTVALAMALLASCERRDRNLALLTLALGLLGLWLTTAFSAVVYRLFFPLQHIQYPWRFLGPATMFLAMFAGFVTSGRWLARFSWSRWVLFGLVLAACIYFSADQRTAKFVQIDLDAEKEAGIEQQIIGGEGSPLEFLPQWAIFDPHARLGVQPRPEVIPKQATISSLEVTGASMSFSIAAEQPSYVVVPWYYFPGWRVAADGAAVPVTIDRSGFIAFNLQPGTQQVRVWFGSTWPRITGWVIASVTLLMLGYLMLLRRRT